MNCERLTIRLDSAGSLIEFAFQDVYIKARRKAVNDCNAMISVAILAIPDTDAYEMVSLLGEPLHP